MKKVLFGLLIGIIFSSGVFATVLYKAKDIEFKSYNTEFKATNVEDAINELYEYNLTYYNDSILNNMSTVFKIAGLSGNTKLDGEVFNIIIDNENAYNYLKNSEALYDYFLISYAKNVKSHPELYNSIPEHTTYSSSVGSVFCDSEYNTVDYNCYNAFGNHGIEWESGNGINPPHYIGYRFNNPVKIVAIYRKNGNQSYPTEMKLQKSDDCSNWTDVYSDFEYVGLNLESNDAIITSDKGKSICWRLYISNTSNGKYVDINRLQFYYIE